MTYLDYREQNFDYQGDRTHVFHGVQALSQSQKSERTITLYFGKQDMDLVQYFQRIVKLLKVDLKFELLEGHNNTNDDVHSVKYFKRKIKNDDKIILFEDVNMHWSPNGTPLYDHLMEIGVSPKNVAVFSKDCLAVDQKPFSCNGNFGVIMKKFYFYNFPQDWMVVFAKGEKLSLKDWMIY